VWVCGVSLFDFFSFLLGGIVLSGGFLPPGFRYVCVHMALAHKTKYTKATHTQT